MNREDGVLNLLANGEIKLAEGARLLGWPYSRVRREALARGIDARVARRALVARLMDEAEAIGREIAAREASGKLMPEALAEVMERRG